MRKKRTLRKPLRIDPNSKFITSVSRLENMTVVRSIRNGLVNMIPVLTIGAFALILNTLPIKAYQAFITTFAGGFLADIFHFVYSATFGTLSLYMTYFISRSFMKIKAVSRDVYSGAAVASLISFFILAGGHLESFGMNNMGPKSMFLAIITGLGSSSLYLFLHRRLRTKSLLSHGVDREFNRMLSTIFPVTIVVATFAVLNVLIIRIFDTESFLALIHLAFNRLFARGSADFFKGFFFVLLASVLWFFGIHGSDTLEGVMENFFTPGLAVNQAAVAAGASPQVILTKEFFDCFVLMGGCGATICLLISILIFSRNQARRGLGITAAFPMLFNINEMMVFGLPVIINPIMLVPFLTVPIVCYSVSYFAIYTGIVPMITSEVTWTTPILLGGYIATGSFAGSLLQLFNVALGVLIYFPFVRLLDAKTAEDGRQQYAAFIDFFRKNEQELTGSMLIERDDVYGDFAKGLCADLRADLRHGQDRVVLYYQPQYHYDGHCIGVEALLRWEHPEYGMIYPPLIIKFAEEGGFLPDLEENILLRALGDRPAVLERFGPDIKLSVNVTGTTVATPRYLQFCRQLNEKEPFAGRNICIEVTEQAALSFNDETIAALRELRKMGLGLAIDDFSMGQTSINYLKENLFTMIKLDGSLVKGLFTHQNCREIISSISHLAGSLSLTVLAEFVETEDQRWMLHNIGCDCYQGYLYSPAVDLSAGGEAR